jgi:hypothetical protein
VLTDIFENGAAFVDLFLIVCKRHPFKLL